MTWRISYDRSFLGRRSESAGFTLVEMIATLGTLLLLAIAATNLLASITDIGLQHRRSLEQRRAVVRFAEVFRMDIHQAASVEATDGLWPLRISVGDQMVEYSWNRQSNEMRRIQRSLAKSDATDIFDSADVFALSDQCEPTLAISEDLVTVLLRHSERTGPWIVEAHR